MNEIWFNLLVILDILIGLALIGLVLINQGQGADMGSGFGAGVSGGVMQPATATGRLTRFTLWVGALFFAISLTLAWMSQAELRQARQESLDSLNLLAPSGLEEGDPQFNPLLRGAPSADGAAVPPALPTGAPSAADAQQVAPAAQGGAGRASDTQNN